MEYSFFQLFLYGFLAIMTLMTALWVISIFIKNVSIVDAFWGIGFFVAAIVYFLLSQGEPSRKLLVLCLIGIWSIRLFIYLSTRNWGKGEDFRYQKFRNDYGAHRYWWFSFFQTFLLQGTLMWLVSLPLLGAMYTPQNSFGALDIIALVIFIIGFLFEAGGDYQMARFKSNPANKGKVLDTGFWKFTRHPNYFGNATLWWGMGIFSIAAGNYFAVIGPIIMTFLLLKVSGVSLLERSLKNDKPGYEDYIRRTSAFIPWFPKK